MALCTCQRSARWLLPALRISLATTSKQLKKDDAFLSHRFSHQFFIMQNPARKCFFQSRAACTQSGSEDGVKGVHPESNLPSISQNQQETIVISRVEMDPLPEAPEDVPPFSPLDVITEDEAAMIVPHPPIPPESFTLRDYVDRSETLQKLVMLGVDLSKLEKRPNVGTLLLKLDFEKDISKILFFLKDVGVEDDQLGPFLTKNPFILCQDLDNLHTRVAYLSSKKFSRHAIARIVSRAPYLLNFSVERLDNRLGFFQKQLGLSGEKTRELVTRLPRMITGSLEPIKENLKFLKPKPGMDHKWKTWIKERLRLLLLSNPFLVLASKTASENLNMETHPNTIAELSTEVFEIEFGFRKNEIQQIALRIPKMLAGNKKKLTETFDYVHNTMGIPHHIITQFPQVFNTSLLKIKERHAFLTFLGRAIYDPTQPNYVSLEKLVSMSNETFCEEIAKTSIQDFEQFQKNM